MPRSRLKFTPWDRDWPRVLRGSSCGSSRTFARNFHRPLNNEKTAEIAYIQLALFSIFSLPFFLFFFQRRDYRRLFSQLSSNSRRKQSGVISRESVRSTRPPSILFSVLYSRNALVRFLATWW